MTFDDLVKRSYSPYSGSPKACLVIDKNGNHYPGVRVENLSYPLSITAIQSALYSCQASGAVPEVMVFPHEQTSADLISFWKKEYKLEVRIDPDMDIRPVKLTESLSMNEILPKLYELCKNAVIPNSSFPVSCLIETEKGFMPGVNIENSNWELGLCAERVALASACAHGLNSLESIHILAPKSDYVSPCGGCRQVLIEHLPQKRVYLYQNETESMSVTTSQLLPYHFKGDTLKK